MLLVILLVVFQVMVVPTGAVSHVIFDFDGLLVDTEPAFTIANQTMLARFGKTFTMDIKRRQMGMKHMESIAWLINEVGIADQVTPEEYARDYDAMLYELFREAKALPGAQRLVEHLVKCNIPVAICTGSCSRTYALKELDHKAWTDLIPLKVLTGDDPNVKRGKPHPDGFLYAMSKFDTVPTSPSSVLVFEDAPNGIAAAQAAGMQCVMVPEPTVFQPDDAYRASVNCVLTSLEEFVPEHFGLPAFEQ